jgi:hypothetical protein
MNHTMEDVTSTRPPAAAKIKNAKHCSSKCLTENFASETNHPATNTHTKVYDRPWKHTTEPASSKSCHSWYSLTSLTGSAMYCSKQRLNELIYEASK